MSSIGNPFTKISLINNITDNTKKVVSTHQYYRMITDGVSQNIILEAKDEKTMRNALDNPGDDPGCRLLDIIQLLINHQIKTWSIAQVSKPDNESTLIKEIHWNRK